KAEGSVPPPDAIDYGKNAEKSIARMYLNDTYGDCVIAGKAHELGVWSGNELGAANTVLATDEEIYRQYQAICGPGDDGCVITDVLDAMKERGFVAGGKAYTIDGYVAVDWTNALEVRVALYLFGTLTLGINLPEAWTEGGDGSTWDETDTNIVGGHDVTAFGYDADGVWIATWGGKRLITWAAFTSTEWLDECYAQLAPLWYANKQLAPCGVDVATLKADLAKLSGGTIPPIEPTPSVPSLPAPVPPLSPGYSGTATLSGTIQMPLGGLQQVTFSGPVNLLPSPQFLLNALDGIFPPGTFMKILAALAPVMIADLAAGKTMEQMIPDIATAILSALASA
ncbi:MAG TPA: hypothetical protein VGL71_02765, partial [Urbifossiella sp.]